MTTAPVRAARALLTLLAAWLGSAGAIAAPPVDLDAYAGRVMKTFEAPGMALAIVEKGQAPLVRAWGVRRLGESAPVDTDTLFAIGSTTKAFTSTALALLVDEGKFGWDSKVADLLPGFRMHDPFASAEMTVRDLLVHRSGLGLGAGDLLFFPPSDRSRADIVRALRHIKPATGFRASFAYDNLLYVVAGELIEAQSGKSWEQFTRERLLAPLGMDRASTSSALPEGANRAWPHARASGAIRGEGPVVALAGPTLLDNAAPAGAINAGIAELARWLELQLGRGLDPKTGKRIFSEAQARELWAPQTVIPVTPLPEPLRLAQPNFRAYALGWNVSDYRGNLLVAHSGGVQGMVTLIAMLPARDVAVAVVANVEDVGVTNAMVERVLDHYLGLESPDWPAAWTQFREGRLAGARAALAKAAADEKARGGTGRGPSLPLAQYAGNYRDDWYGGAVIQSDRKGLRIRLEHTPVFTGTLEHVRHDTFRARWGDPNIEDAYVSFALASDGSIERMTMSRVSPIADFSYDYQDLLFRPEPRTEGKP
jgi:CubicO group peptidase (beta-lactamase class C family)